MEKIKKPSSGGESLYKKKGGKYFSKLAKDGWNKRREKLKLWEKQNKSASKGVQPS